MSNVPIISVIVPVYNASALLADMIESLIRGTYTDFELILVNDGSTDSSGDICDEYASRDSRISAVHTENRGASAARNTGLDLSNGQFIAFIDADDTVAPDYLETLLTEIIKADADIAACNFVPIASDRRDLPVHVLRSRTVTSHREVLWDMAKRHEFYWTNACCKLIRKSAIGALRFPPLRYGEDGYFMFDLIMHSGKLALTDYSGYVYSANGSGVTSADITDIPRRLDEVLLAEHKLKGIHDVPPNIYGAFLDEYARSIHGCMYAFSFSRPSREKKEALKRHIDTVYPHLDSVTPRLARLIRLYTRFRPVYAISAWLHHLKSRIGHLSPKKIVLSLIPEGKIILLESYPAYTDSVKAVYDELISRRINEKYRIYWLASNSSHEATLPENVYTANDSGLFSRFKLRFIKARAKVTVSSNRALPKLKKDQYSLFITHGSAIKKMRSYSLPDGIDEMIVLSETLRISDAIAHGFFPSHAISLGLPRNDSLSLPKLDLHQYFDTECEKFVYWLPTYRHHKVTGASASNKALPLIESREDAERINSSAKENGIFVIIKPHFADDIDISEYRGLSNLCFIDDAFLFEAGIGNYELLRSSDALLTDYSSVYFDYLHLDRPIGLLWEDVDEYRAREGFAIGISHLEAGEKIYTHEDLSAFFKRLSSGEDMLAEKRKAITEELITEKDSNAASRVADLILTHLSE